MSKSDIQSANRVNNENAIKPNKDPSNNRTSKKRMATSPAKGDIVKRSAFGDITNALTVKSNVGFGKENMGKKIAKKTKVATRKSLRVQNKHEDSSEKLIIEKIANVTLSLPKMQSSISSLPNSQKSTKEEFSLDAVEEDTQEFADALDSFDSSELPTAFYQHDLSPRRKDLFYEDLDAENINNPNEAPVYSLVIFEYMRARESQFQIGQYLSTQKEISADMRAILVDWMVEVQENFELNHETLYLAVKLVDLYLQNKQTARDALQLIGATSLLIAAKFDERHPPYIDDFLYICDDAYTRKQMLSLERSLLHIVGFDINIPISYRFLRRYAKCSKTNMQTLTLARFALELSLQCYDLITVSDSLLAAGALWLAFKMNDNAEWTDTLVYYSSHMESEVLKLATRLNSMVEESKGKKLQTVWQKYSHPIFYEVAKTPILSKEKLEKEEERVRLKESPMMAQLGDEIAS
uniref:G2/mitotic-specific cyclin-B3-like n=1 Tax=Styela clava TaxID=7725 RepID=UPI00193A75ED|nr:G2/mitotic-specific cyclin-B3-like [Styela clava]